MNNPYRSDFWNERYARHEYIYGEEPNQFFKTQIDNLKPGKVLLPAEGEGRNAVYAASIGWEVHAYDSSTEGLSKARTLASARNVEIHYEIASHTSYNIIPGEYDLIGLIYSHTDPQTRKMLHQNSIQSLREGGIIVLECFNKKQLGLPSGGPKDIDMLMNVETLREDFPGLALDHLEELEVELNEGDLHKGTASIIRMIGRKQVNG